ncbi:MAG: hypothetical protein OHK0013_12800 [Sandaracinaceae bacterium]
MRALALMLAALLSTAACSAIVSGEPGPLRCEVGGPNPCPEPLVCNASGFCVPSGCDPRASDVCNGIDDDCDDRIDEGGMRPPCESGSCVGGVCREECRQEVCNGRDDDCDDIADEGLDTDRDADSAIACRDGMIYDCDDGNGSVFPGAPERCNFADDNCDGNATERDACASPEMCLVAEGDVLPTCTERNCVAFPSICGPGTVCDASGRCVPGMTGCVVGTRCDAQSYCDATGNCVPLRLLGDPCSRDIECESGLCFRAEALGLPAVAGAAGRCGAACCTDADCGGFECYAPGTGARSCLPLAAIPGGDPPQACVSDRDCAGLACRVLGGSDRPVLACGSPGEGRFLCNEASDCRSYACLPSGVPLIPGGCLSPCASSADCSDAFGESGCHYFVAGGARLPFCDFADGDRRTGSPCSSNADCEDNLCFGAEPQCAGTCCSDAQCPPTHRCRPVNYGGWQMRCLPADVSPG